MKNLKLSEQEKSQFEDMFKSYMHTAIWSSVSDNEDDGYNITDNHDSDDIDVDAKKRMKQDCLEFFSKAKSLIESSDPALPQDTKNKWDLAGYDFWLTQNGHGAGFWDGDWKEHGDDLTVLSKDFDKNDLYIGDDKKIHGNLPKQEKKTRKMKP